MGVLLVFTLLCIDLNGPLECDRQNNRPSFAYPIQTLSMGSLPNGYKM